MLSLILCMIPSTNHQKENHWQGQGCQGDRGHGNHKEPDDYLRQGGWARKQQGRDYGEPLQYANTAAASGQKSRKSGPKFNKRGSSDEIRGVDTRQYAFFYQQLTSNLGREREQNMELDGGKMQVFA